MPDLREVISAEYEGLMNDARLDVSFPSNVKVLRMLRRLGGNGAWHLVKFICWVAANRKDGNLAGMTAEELELVVQWDGEVGAFAKALVDTKFVDGDEGTYSVHDWAEHQPWLSGAEARTQKARWCGIKAQCGEEEADRRVPEYAALRRAAATSSSTSSSTNPPTPSSTPFLSSPEHQDLSSSESLNQSQSQTRELSSPSSKKTARRRTPKDMTIDEFVAACKGKGEPVFPEDGAVMVFAKANNIQDDVLRVCWAEFKDRYGANGVLQAGIRGWRQAFYNCVVGNWYELWDPRQGYKPTNKALGLLRAKGKAPAKRLVV